MLHIFSRLHFGNLGCFHVDGISQFGLAMVQGLGSHVQLGAPGLGSAAMGNSGWAAVNWVWLRVLGKMTWGGVVVFATPQPRTRVVFRAPDPF